MVGPSVPVNDPGVTSPFGMLRFAEEYRAAAALVMRAKDPPGYSAPAFMMIGQSIELSLKAFLLARGVPLDELKFKPYGHDLAALLAEAQRRRIDRLVPLYDFHVDSIKTLAPVYGRHEFRYIVTGTKTIPNWGFISLTAGTLTQCLHDWLVRRRIGKDAAIKRIALRGKF